MLLVDLVDLLIHLTLCVAHHVKLAPLPNRKPLRLLKHPLESLEVCSGLEAKGGRFSREAYFAASEGYGHQCTYRICLPLAFIPPASRIVFGVRWLECVVCIEKRSDGPVGGVEQRVLTVGMSVSEDWNHLKAMGDRVSRWPRHTG